MERNLTRQGTGKPTWVRRSECECVYGKVVVVLEHVKEVVSHSSIVCFVSTLLRHRFALSAGWRHSKSGFVQAGRSASPFPPPPSCPLFFLFPPLFPLLPLLSAPISTPPIHFPSPPFPFVHVCPWNQSLDRTQGDRNGERRKEGRGGDGTGAGGMKTPILYLQSELNEVFVLMIYWKLKVKYKVSRETMQV